MSVPEVSDPARLRASLFDLRSPWVGSGPVPEGHLSPAVGGHGDVYVASDAQGGPMAGSVLRAVDPKTGMERWEAPLKAELWIAPVPSADGTTVWASGEAVVAAFSADTGDRQGTWAPETMDAVRPVPMGGDRAVVSGWKGNRLAALAPGRSEPLWETEVGPLYGVPATGPGRVYASVYNGWQADRGGVIQALDAATGAPAWRYESESPIHESPAVGPDGVVYVSADKGSLVALDPQTGEPLWTAHTEGRPTTAAVSRDGERVFVGDSDGVQALDADTGAPVWRLHTEGAVRLPPGVGPDGVLCLPTPDRAQVALVDSDKGTLTEVVDVSAPAGATPVPLDDGSFLVWFSNGRAERVAIPEPQAPPEDVPGIQVQDTEVTIGGVRIPRR